jgi:peptidoglycan/xylan/chitin deacetylase (PgdA/CDA1 family)
MRGAHMKRLLTTAVALTFLAIGLTGAPAAHATSPTVVTIGFDDGYADQYQVMAILGAYGLHATFYINSGFINTADHLRWRQVRRLELGGNEIAGHTTYHSNVKKLKLGPATEAICGDRDAITAKIVTPPVSFAYPFGSFNDRAKGVVASCGYTTGRGVSGVDDRKTFAETIPPLDPFATRTPPNPKQGTTVATIESYVTAAEDNGGGWVQLVFHHVCDQCDAYSITPANLDELAAWLAARASSGTVVMTTAQVMASA